MKTINKLAQAVFAVLLMSALAVAGKAQESKTRKVISKDGTKIAFDLAGKGPALIVVASALAGRSDAKRFAEFLAQHFIVINYDRRGRGDSGDTKPYAVQREVEDIEALIDSAGGSAFVFGSSSGAVLALEAASKLPAKVKKLALYEPPFIVDDSRPRVPADFVKQVTEFVAAGRRGDAIEYFMTKGVGVRAEFVAQMRNMPMWAGMETLAHTLAYDGAIMGDTQSGKPLPSKRWASATVPTLVMHGGASDRWLRNASAALAGILHKAKQRTLDGQDHSAVFTNPEAVAAALVEFFAGESADR